MKNLFLILCLIQGMALEAQVSISTNLFHAIPLNKALSFEVRINKGLIGNFTKYQMEVPSGVVVEEVDSRSGTFTFEDNKVKIIWVQTPAEPEFAVRMKLKPVSKPVSGALEMKYYYMEENAKKEFETESFSIRFKDTTLPVFVSAPMVILGSKGADQQLSATKPDKIENKDPEILKKQVLQLRKDSREAFRVGGEEKNKAQLKISLIEIEEKKLDQITDPAERNYASDRLLAEKKRARDELVVAERVLVLAAKLSRNADEIERIIKDADNDTKNKSSEFVDTGKPKKEQGAATGNPPLAKVAGANETQGTLIYKIQVAALREKPDLSKFKKYGDVSLVTENGVYKVLIGEFNNKEIASKKKADLMLYFDGCFIVSYQNGKRIL